MKILRESYDDIIDRDGFQRYFEENFNNDCGYSLVANILGYVENQGLNKEETIYLLWNLLDGTGIEMDEIEQFVNGD